VFCWGRGEEGQLGTQSAGELSPVLAADFTAGEIGAGDAHTCAVIEGGQVACWGANDEGQLGTGDTGPRSGPQMVAGLTGAVDISTGSAHTCVTRSDATVWCWGANTSGQLGDGVRLAAGAPGLARVACE
jgi:alpha-tubulin suppressor-like RCC1 family protein